MAAQVALKRQQAAEDAIALGLRAISGQHNGLGYLPEGPVWHCSNENVDDKKDDEMEPETVDGVDSESSSPDIIVGLQKQQQQSNSAQRLQRVKSTITSQFQLI